MKISMEGFLGIPNNDKFNIVLKTKDDLSSFRKYCRKLDIRRRNGYPMIINYRINDRNLEIFRKSLSYGEETCCVITPSGDCYEYTRIVQRESLTYLSMSDFLPYDFRITRDDFKNPDNKYAIFLMNPIDRFWFNRQFNIDTTVYGIVDCFGRPIQQSELDNYTLIAPTNISDQIKTIKHIDILLDTNNLLICKTDNDINFIKEVAMKFGYIATNAHFYKHNSPYTRYVITNGFGKVISSSFNGIMQSSQKQTYLIEEVDFNND